MSFEKHLFISYAHIDNESLTSAEKGWITEFHAALEAFLGMRMGTKAEIWRDERLRGNDDFAREIIGQFPKTALLISILTPRYVNSEWCTREAEEFCKIAQENGGVMIGNKARVFKVIKTPVDSEEALPPPLKDTLGYDFYSEEDGVPLELDLRENPRDYKRKVNKLAWDIADILKNVDSRTEEAFQSSGTAIYLAECSFDRKQEREILEGDLKRHGYRVLPDQPLPHGEEEYIETVSRLLQQVSLSIHLVGGGCGTILDGPGSHLVGALQNQLAAKQSQSNGLPRVIWLPEGTASTHPVQGEFIDSVHRNAEVQFGADLITGDFEELKNTVHNTLNDVKDPPRKETENESSSATEDTSKMIYLICDERDRKATIPVRKYLRQRGFEVVIPVFEGDAGEIREAHREHLAHCDAVIVYYGAGDEAWKRTIDNDLKKVAGYRKCGPMSGKFTYLAQPGSADKEDLIELEEPNLIDGLNDFAESEMSAFIEAINPEEISL